MQLDLLHSLHQLYSNALFLRCHFEPFIVQCSPVFQKDRGPACIADTGSAKNGEDRAIENGEHNGEDKQAGQREQYCHRRACEECFDPLTVVHSLEDVSRSLAIEERQGQIQHFCKKIRHDGDIEPRADMQQDPVPDDIGDQPAQKKSRLRKHDEKDKMDTAAVDADIDDALGKKREQQLEHAANDQPQQQLEEQFFYTAGYIQ